MNEISASEVWVSSFGKNIATFTSIVTFAIVVSTRKVLTFSTVDTIGIGVSVPILVALWMKKRANRRTILNSPSSQNYSVVHAASLVLSLYGLHNWIVALYNKDPFYIGKQLLMNLEHLWGSNFFFEEMVSTRLRSTISSQCLHECKISFYFYCLIFCTSLLLNFGLQIK